MKLPVSWVNTYLERPLSYENMMAALERAGIEVETSQVLSELDVKIIIGVISAVEPHPDADRLKVATIDVKGTELTIVTGAPNITTEAIGGKVAVATVGAVMPDGTRIKAAKLRGITSSGMLCSERELSAGEDHGGIMFLPDDAPIGESVKKILPRSDVIETTTAANRWDLNGIRWIALEVAAQTGQKALFASPPLNSQTVSSKSFVSIAVPELVKRFMIARLSIKPNASSPDWLTSRLSHAGIRSISPIVDVTNYVMVELGQPMHAFDAAKVKLPLIVRQAKDRESFTTLDGTQRHLQSSDLLITDATGPISLAGVMGGQNSEVDGATTEILLEVASFDGSTIRKTAQYHKLRSDASARFERGIPTASPPQALARAISLLQEIAGAEVVGPISDDSISEDQPTTLVARTQRINRLLGLQLEAAEIAHQLVKLEFVVKTTPDSDRLEVIVPWWRPDIQTEDDLAEEVIKLIGYDQLPATLPVWQPHQMTFDHTWSGLWQAKAVLRSAGLFEVMTYSFISRDQIDFLKYDYSDFLKLENPLSSEQAYLRTDLLPSLLAVAERNRTYDREFGMYEFSKVYQRRKPGELPNEPLRLGVMQVASHSSYPKMKSILDRLSRIFNVPVRIVPDTLHQGIVFPNRVGQIEVEGSIIGWIGEIDPTLTSELKIDLGAGYLELEWEPFLAAARPKQYRSRNRFPVAMRDIAIVVPRSLTWGEIAATLTNYEVRFMNDYYGDELGGTKKSVAFQLIISYSDRTPTDNDADQAVKAVVAKLEERFKAKLRISKA